MVINLMTAALELRPRRLVRLSMPAARPEGEVAPYRTRPPRRHERCGHEQSMVDDLAGGHDWRARASIAAGARHRSAQRRQLRGAGAGCRPDRRHTNAWSGRGDGGRHLYFERPYGELTSTRLPKGIDLKSNGYTILPPSVHPASGEPYRWELREVAPLTRRFRELLRLLPVLRTHGRQTGVNGSGLVRLVLALKDGERNRGLFWAACRAAEGGILNHLSPT